MKKMGRIRIVFGIFVSIFCLMTACSWGKEEIDYCNDIPKLCEQELQKCFGEEYVLSEGVEKEVSFFDEYECRELITRHTEWELTYKDMDG